MVDRKSIKNLLNQPIPVRKGPSRLQEDFSRKVENVSSVEVVFRRHKHKLVDFIGQYDVLLGAIAWFTDEDVISALSTKRVSILVQKEDFLRPDYKGSKGSLRAAYNLLYSYLSAAEIGGILGRMQYPESIQIDPVRCVGNLNTERNPAFPRMHNKFLIGCDYITEFEDTEGPEHPIVYPRAVWTGSYNFSYNARASFENAVIVTDDQAARAFLEEWSQIYILSENLDWSEEWVAPELWVGT